MTAFTGRTAVVTGGANGIGEAVAEVLRAQDARVGILDVDTDRGPDVARRLDAEFVAADLTRPAEVAGAFETFRRALGPVDVLVNNAGINAYYDATAMTEEEWDQFFSVDLAGAWRCSKQVLPGMVERRAGSIVNITSIHARLTMQGMFPYAAAKSGLLGLTRSLALDYGQYGIRVNAVAPGWTRTGLVQEWLDGQPDPQAADAAVGRAHALGRMAEPAEIAAVVAFVASDAASFITGAQIPVDGGMGARFAT